MKTAQDLVAAAKARTTEVALDQAQAAIRDADVVLDVREAEEFATSHIPGAIHASRGMLEFKLGMSPELSRRDLKAVVYCKTSGRAALAAASMLEMGYTDVKVIAGGFDAWQAAGLPVHKPAQPKFD